MKILLMRFSALGDVAMVAPVLRRMAEKYPDVDITMLSQPFCAPIFENIAPNVHFMGADVKGEYSSIAGLTKLFNKLHCMKFDFVFDLHDVLRTKYLRQLFRLYGYRVSKINKHRELRKEITAAPPKKNLRPLPTSFSNYAEALVLRDIAFSVDTANADSVRRPSVVNRIGIAPFAAHQGKIYPIERMEKVIQQLLDKEVILFGGGGEEGEIMSRWEKVFPNVKKASTLLDQQGHKCCLAEELELMKTLDVMVSMDSANMHLASLVGVRVVSIWGATHPYAGFLGWGQSMDDCVQVDLPCRPCSIYGNKPCQRGDMACMMHITPEIIVDRILN